jgi:hypothetical protein
MDRVDPFAELAADPVDQGRSAPPGCRDDQTARRLRDHQQVLVGVEDRQVVGSRHATHPSRSKAATQGGAAASVDAKVSGQGQSGLGRWSCRCDGR